MKESTMVRAPSFAPSVTTNAQHQTILNNIKVHPLVINNSAFHCVTTNAQHQVNLRNMKELTTVINHSAASIVNKNPQNQAA